MPQKYSKAEIISKILEEYSEVLPEDEEALHLLLDKTVSQDINSKHTINSSLANKISDSIAKTVGSWTFIIIFCVTLLFWIISNAFLLGKAFDPYPFILLNLVLSCIAAIQAPIIMMSQNRQETKDRLRSENDYKVNLKTELISEDIHSKLDKIIMNQEEIMLKLKGVDGKSNI